MSEQYKDYSAQNQALINRETNRFERKKEEAKALSENFRRTVAAALKDPATKKNVAKDALQRAKGQQSGESSYLDRYTQGTYVNDGEVIKGTEPRPWERD